MKRNIVIFIWVSGLLLLFFTSTDLPRYINDKNTAQLQLPETSSMYYRDDEAIKKHNEQVRLVDTEGFTPLQYAFYTNDFDKFKSLINNGANINALIKAKSYEESLFEWLLFQEGGDGIKFANFLLTQESLILGKRSLRIAIRLGDINMIKAMLDRGIPAVGIAEIGMRQDQALDILKLLLKYGASVKQEEKDNDYATDIGPIGDSLACDAASVGKNDILKLLLENGASTNGVFEKHPLHCAAYDDIARIMRQPQRPVNLEGIKILLDAGADPFLRSASGTTFWQTIEKDSDKAAVLKILSERNIDVSKLK